MLDIKRIRENYEEVKAGVEKRGKGGFGIERVRELDIRRREILAEVEALKNKHPDHDSERICRLTEGNNTGTIQAKKGKTGSASVFAAAPSAD